MAETMMNGAAAAAPLSEVDDLGKRIMGCGKKTWSSLRNALGTKTREAAVELCGVDPEARKIATQVLDAEDAATTEEIMVPAGGTRKVGKKIQF